MVWSEGKKSFCRNENGGTELRNEKLEKRRISGLNALMIASPPFIGLRGRWSSFGSCNRTARGGVGLAVFFVRLQQTTDAQLAQMLPEWSRRR